MEQIKLSEFFLSRHNKFALVVVLGATLLLTSCGGGGGGGNVQSSSTNESATASNQNTSATPNTSNQNRECVNTNEGCLTETAYNDRIANLRTTYSSHRGFTNQWGLRTIKADSAWAKIQLKHGTAPGSGLTVGVLDSGIDKMHPYFAGKSIDEHLFSGASDETGTESSHGTAVASVITASPNDSAISQGAPRGVAWGADLAMFAVPVGSGDPDRHEPVTPQAIQTRDTTWASRVNHMVNWSKNGRSLDFVNVSLGFTGIIDLYSTTQLRSNIGSTISALAQSGSNDKTVFVWAAGNSHSKECEPSDFGSNTDICITNNGTDQATRPYIVNAKSPGILAGLAARFPELRSNNVSVVAIDSSGNISSFSNRCGIAANWCIAAPGESIAGAYFGPDDNNVVIRGRGIFGGTSVAAPMVTGGLVLMKHLFRDQLSNTDLVSRLYATADKSGQYSNRSIYGQGLMDLDAATSPVEFTNISTSNVVDGSGYSVQNTGLALGNAFGDGMTNSLSDQEIAAFDALGAPFWYSFGHLTQAGIEPSLSTRLNAFLNQSQDTHESQNVGHIFGTKENHSVSRNSEPLSLSLTQGPELTEIQGHLSLASRALMMSRNVSDQWGINYFTTKPISGKSPVSAVELSFHGKGMPYTLRSGMVSEKETLLGSSSSGAFGHLSGRSAFASIEGNTQIGLWKLEANAEIGSLNPNSQNDGLLTIESPLLTSAFALRAKRSLSTLDHISLSFSQPIRIESGRAQYYIPVGRTIAGDVLHQSGAADLEPTGRQIDLSTQWQRNFRQSGDFRLAAQLSLQPGHSVKNDPRLTVLAAWRMGF